LKIFSFNNLLIISSFLSLSLSLFLELLERAMPRIVEEEESSGDDDHQRKRNKNVALIRGNSDFCSDWKLFSLECLGKDLKNAQSLLLTEKLLSRNAAEYTVWWFRLRCVKFMFHAFGNETKKTGGEATTTERGDVKNENRFFEATKGKLWRSDRERKEKIERLVASAEEMNRFREELIDLGVDETHVDEAREYFRSVDSPLIWYSAETLAKFRSGALTRKMLERMEEERSSDEEAVEEELPTTSLFWQHGTCEDGLKALSGANYQRDYIERLRECCEKVREIFPRTKYDILDEEYAFAEAMASRNPKNYQVWNHLRQIATLDDRQFRMETSLLDQHSYRRRAFFFQSNVNCDGPFLHHFNDQMRSGAAIRSKYFVENVILFGDDGLKNIHAWTHYVWIAKNIDPNVWLDVFYATEMCVRKDPRNNSAWTARMNYAKFMIVDERENESNTISGWNNSEHLKWAVGRKDDETSSNSIFNDASSIEEKGVEMITRETSEDHAMDASGEGSVDVEGIRNIYACVGADYSVWCTPGPRFTPEYFLAYDAAVIMEDVLGFDLTSFHNVAKETNREQYENVLRGFGEDNVYAPDSEAAMNYVLGLFALMKKMSRPTLLACEGELRRAFLEESEKKIHQMNALTKRDYEAKIASNESRNDFTNPRTDTEAAQFERELNAFRRLKVSAKLSAAQVKAFRLEKGEDEELQSTTNPSSTTLTPEITTRLNANESPVNALKSLRRCLITDPVRSNFYRNHFVLRR